MDYVKHEFMKLINRVKSSNPFEIAKFLKIEIVTHHLPKTVKGYSTVDRRNKIIVLNDRLGEYESTAVLCHELGHAVLHPYINTTFFSEVGSISFVSKIEYEANCFMFYLIKENMDMEDVYSKYEFLKQIGMPESMSVYIDRCW